MHPHERLVAEMLQARYGPRDLTKAATYFGPDVVWHMHAGESHPFSGDFIGISGLSLFARLTDIQSDGTFDVHTTSISAIGDHLVAAHLVVTMTKNGFHHELDTAWLCRFEDGKIVEVWDVVARVPDELIHAAAEAVAAVEEEPR